MNSQNVAVPLLRVEGRTPQSNSDKDPLLSGQPSFSRTFEDGVPGASVAAVAGAALSRVGGQESPLPSGRLIHPGYQRGLSTGHNTDETSSVLIQASDTDGSMPPLGCGSGCELEHPETSEADEPLADVPPAGPNPRSCGAEHAVAAVRLEGKPEPAASSTTSWSTVEEADVLEAGPEPTNRPDTPIDGETLDETGAWAPIPSSSSHSVLAPATLGEHQRALRLTADHSGAPAPLPNGESSSVSGAASQTAPDPVDRLAKGPLGEEGPTPGTSRPVLDGSRDWLIKDGSGAKGLSHDKQVSPVSSILATASAATAVSTEAPTTQPPVEQAAAPKRSDFPAVARFDDAPAHGRQSVEAGPVNLIPGARALSGRADAPNTEAGFGADQPRERAPLPNQPAPSAAIPGAEPQISGRNPASDHPAAVAAMNPLLSISEVALESRDEALFSTVSEIQGPSASRHGAMHIAPTHVSGGAEMARQVASQIAVAAQADGSTEIALDPEELGRVRLRLTGTETAMSVLIIAERPETAELMRRHVDALAQEFRDIGYSDLQFQFESGTSDQQDSGESESAARLPVQGELREEPAPLAPVPTGRPDGTSGLDLRL